MPSFCVYEHESVFSCVCVWVCVVSLVLTLEQMLFIIGGGVVVLGWVCMNEVLTAETLTLLDSPAAPYE